MSKEKCGSKNGINNHNNSGSGCKEPSTNSLTGAEEHGNQSDAAHVRLEHLNGKVDATEELNEAHRAEYQNPSADSFSLYGTNKVQ